MVPLFLIFVEMYASFTPWFDSKVKIYIVYEFSDITQHFVSCVCYIM